MKHSSIYSNPIIPSLLENLESMKKQVSQSFSLETLLSKNISGLPIIIHSSDEKLEIQHEIQEFKKSKSQFTTGDIESWMKNLKQEIEISQNLKRKYESSEEISKKKRRRISEASESEDEYDEEPEDEFDEEIEDENNENSESSSNDEHDEQDEHDEYDNQFEQDEQDDIETYGNYGNYESDEDNFDSYEKEIEEIKKRVEKSVIKEPEIKVNNKKSNEIKVNNKKTTEQEEEKEDASLRLLKIPHVAKKIDQNDIEAAIQKLDSNMKNDLKGVYFKNENKQLDSKKKQKKNKKGNHESIRHAFLVFNTSKSRNFVLSQKQLLIRTSQSFVKELSNDDLSWCYSNIIKL